MAVIEIIVILIRKFMFLVRLNGKFFRTGFSHVPGGNAYRDRSVLSYHYYCTILAIKPVSGNAKIPLFDRVLCNWIEEPAVFHSVQVN
jgi:endoglycosylceramidase